ncbi:MAG: hypothetical protein RLN83_15620, partial [Balneola sp.]
MSLPDSDSVCSSLEVLLSASSTLSAADVQFVPSYFNTCPEEGAAAARLNPVPPPLIATALPEMDTSWISLVVLKSASLIDTV